MNIIHFRILSRTRVLSPEDHLAASRLIQLSDADATYRYPVEQEACEKIKRKPKLRSLKKLIPSPQTKKLIPSPQTMHSGNDNLQNQSFFYILVLHFCTFFSVC